MFRDVKMSSVIDSSTSSFVFPTIHCNFPVHTYVNIYKHRYQYKGRLYVATLDLSPEPEAEWLTAIVNVDRIITQWDGIYINGGWGVYMYTYRARD